MSGPFAPGDVVVCVDAQPSDPFDRDCVVACARLAEGRPYRVAVVRTGHYGEDGVGIGVPNADLWPHWGDLWQASRFRHLPEADETFTAQMRAIKPIRERCPS